MSLVDEAVVADVDVFSAVEVDIAVAEKQAEEVHSPTQVSISDSDVFPVATDDEGPSLIEEWVHGSLFFFFVGILGLLAKIVDYWEGTDRLLIDPASLLCCVLGFLCALPFSYGRSVLFICAREFIRACMAVVIFFINRVRS